MVLGGVRCLVVTGSGGRWWVLVFVGGARW